MLGTTFYNQSIRRVVTSVGNLFNEISINQHDTTGALIKTIPVPISYAKKQHFIAKLNDDLAGSTPNVNMILPRMSFSFEGFQYDSERQISPLRYTTKPHATDNNFVVQTNTFIPYNMDFEVNIVAKNIEDSLQIVEQIVPYFTPDFNMPIKFTDEETRDVSFLINSLAPEDNADDGFNANRLVAWSLSFTARAWVVGASKDSAVIKTAIVNLGTNKNDLGDFLIDETLQSQVVPTSAGPDDVHTVVETITSP